MALKPINRFNFLDPNLKKKKRREAQSAAAVEEREREEMGWCRRLGISKESSVDHKCGFLNQCAKREQDKSFAYVIEKSFPCMAVLGGGVFVDHFVRKSIRPTDVNILVVSPVQVDILRKDNLKCKEDHDDLCTHTRPV